jgi:hypothetical protein
MASTSIAQVWNTPRAWPISAGDCDTTAVCHQVGHSATTRGYFGDLDARDAKSSKRVSIVRINTTAAAP